MDLLITGGTGLVGRALCRAALRAGHGVTVLTRDPARARATMPGAVNLRRWLPPAPFPAEELRGQNAVVNLAGESIAGGRWSAARKRRIEASRVGATEALMAALARLNAGGPTTVLSASAVGIYGPRGDEALDEGAAPGTDFLAQVCRAWEGALFTPHAGPQRRIALRTGLVLSGQGGLLPRLLPLFRLGLGGRLGHGRQWMSWIHVDDLVGLMLFLLDRDGPGGVFNATAPEPVTNRAFTQALAAALHRPALLPVPALAVRLALGEMALLALTGQRVLPRAALDAGYTFAHPEIGGALRHLLAPTAGETTP